MLNLKYVHKALNCSKDEIVDILCEIYGKEYKKELKEKFNNTYFDFTSLPIEEYIYLENHQEEFMEKEKKRIQQNFFDYKQNKDEAFEGVVRLKLSKEIKRCFGIDTPNKQDANYDKFVSLFVDENFNGGIIDCFSDFQLKSIIMANTSKSLIESHFKDRMQCQKMLFELNIPISIFTGEGAKKVNDFMLSREQIKNNTFRGFIAKYSNYGKKIHKEIKKKYRINLPETVLGRFIFNEHPEFLNIATNGKNVSYIIKVPLATMANHNIECCDLSIIHELIHRMETNGGEIGLSDEGKNIIVNEIRTQKIAFKIVEAMRERGIFLVDSPSTDPIIDRSFYRNLFPLFGDFCEKYEKVLSSCALENKGKDLEMIFGPCWNEYSSLIDDVYHNYGKLLEIKEEKVIAKFENRCKMLIKDMEDYYEKREKDVRRFVKN